MLFVKQSDSSDFAEQMKQAASLLQQGGTVAFPTETVYGLGANALNAAAVQKIFEAKGRPGDNPLIVHIADRSALEPLVTEIPDCAYALMNAFWPGPLTLVFPKAPCVPDVVTAGLNTVAVRFPAHPIAQQFLKACHCPVAAPSANTSGRPSPTEAGHVIEDLYGKIDALIDGGPCQVGLESTVLDISGPVPVLLRPGRITPEQLREVLGEMEISAGVAEQLSEGEVPRSPGMKYRHYAPNTDVCVVRGEDDQVVLYINHQIAKNHADGKRVGVMVYQQVLPQILGADVLLSLGDVHHRSAAAASLFSHLRHFEQEGVSLVLAQDSTDTGLGLAIGNRLHKAAGYQIIDLR